MGSNKFDFSNADPNLRSLDQRTAAVYANNAGTGTYSHRTIRAATEAGKLQGQIIGRGWRYSINDIRAWLGAPLLPDRRHVSTTGPISTSTW